VGTAAPILTHCDGVVKSFFTFFATFLIWLVFLPNCPIRGYAEHPQKDRKAYRMGLGGDAPRQNASAVSKRSAQTKCQIEVLK